MLPTNLALLGIVPEQLTEDNYEYWKVCMTSYLIGQGLWNVVSGEEAQPQHIDANYEIWRRKNALALHAIQISCGPNVVSKIRETDSAKFAWVHLAEKRDLPPPSPLLNDEDPIEKGSLDFLKYETLFKAVDDGDWEAAKDFLEAHPDSVRAKISSRDDTALHVAILAGHGKIVDELLNLMTPEDLELKNEIGTVLSTVSISDKTKMAKALVNKNANLVGIVDVRGQLPIVVAAIYGRKDMVEYLYSVTPMDMLSPKYGLNGVTLLNCLITAEIYDLALNLLQRYPRLGIKADLYGNYSIRILAQKPSAFPSGSKPVVFWKQGIYSLLSVQPSDSPSIRRHCERPSQGPSDEENLTRPQRGASVEENIISRVLTVMRERIWNLSLCVVPDLKQIYDRKLVHVQALELLGYIAKEIRILSKSQLEKIVIDEAIYDAINHGIIEFIVKIIANDPETILRRGKKGRSMFAHAIVLRQEEIFSLIYGLGTNLSIMAGQHDMFANNILHLAGKLSPPSQLERVSGAALQMQRELQWFKEMENIVLAKYKEEVNENNKTPRALFTEEHADLVKEGERWMKNTAASCMVVATLIAALMFTVAFTVPGGINNDTGIPIFLGNNAFMVFIASDALSLFSSSTSVLMFLGVLTSRYAEEDFLKSLPLKLVIGLSSLFFSIVSMMVAFGSALFIVVHKRLEWVTFPIIVLATIPISLFVLLQFPLLLEIFLSTYGPGIFKKPTKRPY
ncbi:hypothetical protein L1049_019469 [Liquidambar formosana]|uniref:PGG domain-containing protein n=1 Tax=Liquidambar formosana TaxID=63359 RepID=A0AAP0X5A8_LIQFO